MHSSRCRWKRNENVYWAHGFLVWICDEYFQDVDSESKIGGCHVMNGTSHRIFWEFLVTRLKSGSWRILGCNDHVFFVASTCCICCLVVIHVHISLGNKVLHSSFSTSQKIVSRNTFDTKFSDKYRKVFLSLSQHQASTRGKDYSVRLQP